MSELEFKPGDVVYHKSNNLRMVVTGAGNNQATCKYVNKNGSFEEKSFLVVELLHNPIKEAEDAFPKVIVQLTSSSPN